MNKIIFMSTMFFFVSACDHRIDCNWILRLKNKTNKHILLEVEKDFTTHLLKAVNSDTTTIVSVKTKEDMCNYEWSYHSRVLYSLSDTSLLRYKLGEDMYSKLETRTDSIRHNSITESEESSNTMQSLEICITVTDTLLTIFEKDYTMLDKFKEYYQK